NLGGSKSFGARNSLTGRGRFELFRGPVRFFQSREWLELLLSHRIESLLKPIEPFASWRMTAQKRGICESEFFRVHFFEEPDHSLRINFRFQQIVETNVIGFRFLRTGVFLLSEIGCGLGKTGEHGILLAQEKVNGKAGSESSGYFAHRMLLG